MPVAKVMVTEAKLTRIGDAIREKLEESTQYTLDEMPAAIGRIPSDYDVSPGSEPNSEP